MYDSQIELRPAMRPGTGDCSCGKRCDQLATAGKIESVGGDPPGS